MENNNIQRLNKEYDLGKSNIPEREEYIKDISNTDNEFSIDNIYGLEIDQIIELGWKEIDIIDQDRIETMFDNAKTFKKDNFILRTIYGYLNGKIFSSNIVIYNNFVERFFYGECPNKETLIQLEKLIGIK